MNSGLKRLMHPACKTFLRGLAVSAFIGAGTAWAQVNIPSTAQPGRVGQTLGLQPQLPEVGGEPLITLPGEGGHETPLKNSLSFTLNGIRLEGNTVLSNDELKPAYAEYLGKPVTLATLNRIAAKITARYRNAGYILSQAVLPPQKIKGGVVTIRIIEGHISRVEFQGKTVTGGLLREYAERIQDERPLNMQTLERYLLLMDDLPGLTAHAFIRPSRDISGASDLVVTVEEKHFDGTATLDNRGTRYLGPLQGGITVDANDMLGLYDQTQLHGVNTAELNEMHYGQFVHQEQLDDDGTKATFSASRTASYPAYKLRSFDVQGTDTDYNLAVSHPFIRSRRQNLYGTVTLDARETNNDSLGTQLYHDSLRILRLDGAYDFADSLSGVNRVEATVSKGFGWDTSADGSNRSRADGHPEFYKGDLQASRLQQISGPYSVYVAATGQAASDTLLAAEEFGLGGPAFGSAYDPSEIIGDAGIAGRAELRYSRSGDWDLIPSYQFYGFYDIGKVWIRDAAAGADTASLADAGLGVRFNLMQPLSGSLELAEPLTKPVAALGQEGHQPRVFFSLAYRY